MKNNNGFIATSMLYTFFLAFVTLFIGVVTLYLQNRVYLNKLEDSSKNAIYLREITDSSTLKIVGNENECTKEDINIYQCGDDKYNLTKCENMYRRGTIFYAKGCEKQA